MPKVKVTSPCHRFLSPSPPLSPTYPPLPNPTHSLLDENGTFIMSTTTSQPR